METAKTNAVMRTVHPRSAATAAHAAIWVACIGGLLWLGGCAGKEVTAPGRTWEEVRYHWSEGLAGDSFGDMTVRASGETTWELQGQGAPIRGLLAGENLETLTRLIDALPPAPYRGSAGCDRKYFVTVTTAAGERTFSSSACDGSAPAPLRSLADEFDHWAQDAQGRPEVVVWRPLAQGSYSRMTGAAARVAANRDELLTLLGLLGADRPTVLPAVDFGKEIVVALFLGERPSSGFAIEVTDVGHTPDGRLLISESVTEPGPGCAPAQRATQPYVLIAIQGGAGAGFIEQTDVVTQPCGLQAGAR